MARSRRHQELNRRANRLAHGLLGLGIGPEALVGICVEPSPEMVVALLGVMKAGGAFVPLDPAYPKEVSAFVLGDTQVGVVLTQRSLLDTVRLLGPTLKLISLDALEDTFPEAATDDPVHLVQGANLLCVIYPRVRDHGPTEGFDVDAPGLRNCLLSVPGDLRLVPRDRLLQKAPLNFDVSIWEVLWPLSRRGQTWC